MKKKHGFIGNSSSASYYIRRGAKSQVNGEPFTDGLETTFTVGGTAGANVGLTYDGSYKWDTVSTFTEQSIVDIPIAVAGIVNRVSFTFGGLVISGIFSEITPVNMAGYASIYATSVYYHIEGLADVPLDAPCDVSGVNSNWVQDVLATEVAPDPGTLPAPLTLQIQWNGVRLRIINKHVVGNTSTSASGSTYIKDVTITTSV